MGRISNYVSRVWDAQARRGAGGGSQPSCAGCDEPIDERQPHVTYNRHVETLRGNTVTVHDADVMEQRHTACDQALSGRRDREQN